MDRRERIAREAQDRVRSARRQIERSIGFADRGFPLAAEPERERLIQRLQGKAGLSREDAIGLARGLTDSRTQQSGPERIWGRTADFVGVAFLLCVALNDVLAFTRVADSGSFTRYNGERIAW